MSKRSGDKSHSHNESQMMIWLIVDGVGLAMITACTLFDAMTAWRDNFRVPLSTNYNSNNTYLYSDLRSALFFWFFGRFLQVIGLFLLISYAATFQHFVELERGGMLMLTAGPILNIVACILFEFIDLKPIEEELDLFSGEFKYSPNWLATELNELVGILILDISMIDMEEIKVVIAEIIGFTVLGGAALLEYYFEENQHFPVIILRRDLVHICDAIGLFFLTLVGIAHYRSKVAIKKQLEFMQSNTHLI